MKPTRDPIYLEIRRQALVDQIRALAILPVPARPAMLGIRRRQRALNFINKRLARIHRATTPRKEVP